MYIQNVLFYFIYFLSRKAGGSDTGRLGSSSMIEPPEIIIIVRFEWKESICVFFSPFFCLLRALRGGKKNCGGNTEERCKGRWEIKDGWKQMRVRGGERGKKIGWEMRDCAARNSQPAGPARCLGDCKLSLRMQTDKQDRHHLPVLPSTTETVAHASPSLPPSYFHPSLYFQAIFVPLFHPLARMFMNSLICFRRLPRAAAPPLSGAASLVC